ncbi:MAG: N-acetylmuramoyl-L-alanine amidase [Candidatus Sericytochromatia bacterium]|nr:N-acetylmuramoyl-L-alanine amidase [Candidatus Sericytochromatia bacterium]
MTVRAWMLCTVATLTLSSCASWTAQHPAEADDVPMAPRALFQPQRSHLPMTMPPVATMLSPNQNSRKGSPITTIVLHHTASAASAVAIAKYFQRRDAQVSSHYVVDRDGSIIRCVPEAARAWHAGPSAFEGVSNVNDYSIGIELCNIGDGIEPYPVAQTAAVTQLVASLVKRYGIPLSRVTRHRDVALPHGTKIDPSDNFDFSGVVVTAGGMLAGDQVTATMEVTGGESQL